MGFNRVALVTGASSGIGQATAESLAAHGFTVFGGSRTPFQGARSYVWLPLDVRSDDSVKAAVQAVREQAGRIDVLVNAAGFVQFGAIEESSIMMEGSARRRYGPSSRKCYIRWGSSG